MLITILHNQSKKETTTMLHEIIGKKQNSSYCIGKKQNTCSRIFHILEKTEYLNVFFKIIFLETNTIFENPS